MGRRPKPILQTFATCIIMQIETLRKQHPGWGPKTIYHELEHDPRFRGLALPKPSTIALFLKAKGLTRRYGKHYPMPLENATSPKKSHQLWELDAQGNFQLDPIGPISMINIKDVFSLTYCMAFPNKKKSIGGHPKRADYQCALRLAFMEKGLPEAIQTDHESIFYENKSKSPFPTILHLWLISLGISQVFSRIHHPTDQAHVERMHQVMESQVIQGGKYRNWEALFQACQKRRNVLNETYPCSSIGNRAPLQVFPEARHSGRDYHPQREEKMMDINKVYEFLAKGKWFRWTSKTKTITLGGQAYYLLKFKPNEQVQITFELKKSSFIFHDDKEKFLGALPIQNLTKQTLMGQLYWALSNVQLKIPFSWEAEKFSMTLLDNN